MWRDGVWVRLLVSHRGIDGQACAYPQLSHCLRLLQCPRQGGLVAKALSIPPAVAFPSSTASWPEPHLSAGVNLMAALPDRGMDRNLANPRAHTEAPGSH